MATNWAQLVEEIRPHVVKIQTMNGWGTGFFCARIPKLNGVGIATAQHVIEHAEDWNQPLKLYCCGKKPITLPWGQWLSLSHKSEDASVVVVLGDKVEPPSERLPRVDSTKYLAEGHEVGWVGFPSVYPDGLCFFSGRVSVYDRPRERYLLDGVSIPGVSGGPVFYRDGKTKALTLMGSITGYTRPGGGREAVGLCVANEITKAKAIETQLAEILAEQKSAGLEARK